MRYFTRVGVCVVVGLLLLPVSHAMALSVGNEAPLPAGTVLFDPVRFTQDDLDSYQLLFGPQATLGYYSRPTVDLAAAPEWELVDSIQSAFDDHVTGVLCSQAWRHADGHILLAYQLTNTGDVAMSGLKFSVRGAPLAIVDSGVLGDGTDVQYVSRMGADEDDEVVFRIGHGEMVELHNGESTSWVFLETNALTYHMGLTTVQNHTASADNVQLLVPCPEPMTFLAVGLGMVGLGGYVVRKRKLA